MFGDYVFEKTAAQYTKKMLLVDADHLEEKAHYLIVKEDAVLKKPRLSFLSVQS